MMGATCDLVAPSGLKLSDSTNCLLTGELDPYCRKFHGPEEQSSHLLQLASLPEEHGNPGGFSACPVLCQGLEISDRFLYISALLESSSRMGKEIKLSCP